MRRVPLSLVLLSLLSPLALLSSGCEPYDGPPEPRIEGAEDGSLDDANAPIVLAFSEPIDPSTLIVQLVRYETDIEGNLADEDSDPNTELDPLFLYDPRFFPVGGEVELAPDNTWLRITPDAPLPIGPKLAILVDAGLADLSGHVTKARRRLLFGYKFDLDCDAPSTVFPTGSYFLLADIKQPIMVQVQLWASFQVDPATGRVRGQATNADRNPDPNRCPMPCDGTEVCRLYPAPDCVAPSERAGTVDEHGDYIPNDVLPTGFSFTIDGCAVDQSDGSAVFATAPTDVVVQSPPVTLRNVTLTAQFAKDGDGVLRGTGSLAADSVLLGTTSSGKGEGALTGRLVPAKEAPPGIPQPPPASP